LLLSDFLVAASTASSDIVVRSFLFFELVMSDRDVTISMPFRIGGTGIGDFLRKIKLENFEQPMIDSGFSTQESLIRLHKISSLLENSLFLMKKLSFIFLKKLPMPIPQYRIGIITSLKSGGF
jgi:hypothetical protein